MSSEPQGDGEGDGGRGDDREFGAITKLHRPYLHRVAVKLSKDPVLAEDLVQEALLRGARHFDRLQDGTRVRAWLAKILGNVFRDYLKHQKVIRRAEQDLLHLVADSDENDDDSVFCRVGDERLEAAIRALEPDLREVVELCYLGRMRHREAAAVLQVPMGTIGTRLMRARERLRESLSPQNLRVVKP